MTATPDDESALRERRCIACGEVLPEDRLVRFVVSPDGEVIPETVVREGPKIGRNDPCPCGSGKKYKKCHGATTA